MFCHTHIHNIVRLEVDLGGTARPLDHQQIIFLLKAVKGFLDRAPCLERIALVILTRTHIANRLSHDDDLRLRVSRRFQQHGVHVDHRSKPRRFRLCDLRTPHLASVERNV